MATFCAEEHDTGYLCKEFRTFAKSKRQRPSVFVSSSLADECLSALRGKAQLAVVIGSLWELKSIALELFDSVTVEFEVDPEVSDSYFLNFNVTATGDIEEISSRRREWHRRTYGFLGQRCGLVRLLIDVK